LIVIVDIYFIYSLSFFYYYFIYLFRFILSAHYKRLLHLVNKTIVKALIIYKGFLMAYATKRFIVLDKGFINS